MIVLSYNDTVLHPLFDGELRTHFPDVDLIELERVGGSTLERVPSTFGFLDCVFDDLVLITEHRDRDIGVRASACFGARLRRHDVVRL